MKTEEQKQLARAKSLLADMLTIMDRCAVLPIKEGITEKTIETWKAKVEQELKTNE